MQQETVTLIVAGLGIAGTLGGAIVGNLFQVHGQHQQWRRDNVRQECRELLGQLSVNLFAYIDWYKSLDERGNGNPVFAKRHDDAVVDLHRNLGSRILIAKEIRKAQITQRWGAALISYSENRNVGKLNAEYQALAEEIVNIGLKA